MGYALDVAQWYAPMLHISNLSKRIDGKQGIHINKTINPSPLLPDTVVSTPPFSKHWLWLQYLK